MADVAAIANNEGQGRDGLRTADVRVLGYGLAARLEKLFFLLLALCPFAMGAVYAVVNMMGGWTLFSAERSFEFYGIMQYGFNFLSGVFGATAIFLSAWFVSKRVSAEYQSRRTLLFDLLWIFLLSFGLRACFFLVFGREVGNTMDPLWAWNRACGISGSSRSHLFSPAWMNYALYMKGFVFVFGSRFGLFQLMGTIWGGVGGMAVVLMAHEISRSRKAALFAGLLYALSPNGIVYMSAGATSEHVAAPLFCLAAWLFARGLVRHDMATGRLLASSAVSGFILGLGDAIKPFFPVFLPAALVLSGCLIAAADAGCRLKQAFRIGVAVALLSIVRCLVCGTVTVASERTFDCDLDRSDSFYHFLCVGLDRCGEGMIARSQHAWTYVGKRLAGISRDESFSATIGPIMEEWKGHWGNVPEFLCKKTIWSWQDDVQGFVYYRLNMLHGNASCSATARCMPWICRHGASVALVFYGILMTFACLFAVKSALTASVAGRQRRMFPGLLIFGFFCLLLLSESQGRYKCIVMPEIIVFAACALKREEHAT